MTDACSRRSGVAFADRADIDTEVWNAKIYLGKSAQDLKIKL